MINQAHVSYPFLLAIIVGTFFHYNFSVFQLLVIMLFAWLPDFDYPVALYLSKKYPNKKIRHHEFITHSPLFYLPFLLIIALFDWEIAFLAFYGLLTHFIMDSLIAPDGIRWFYPFSRKYYLWTGYTKGIFETEAWLRAYKKLLIYKLDNIAFLLTIILVIYLIF